MENKYFILNVDEHKNLYTFDVEGRSPFETGVPLLDISDETIRQIYYFRWHTYCSHIKETPEGYVVTEFQPNVAWAGKYNTISCPLGHHFYEGRWIHNQKYLSDNAKFWLSESAAPRKYSSWLGDCYYAYAMVTGNFELVEELYEKIKENYFIWEQGYLQDNGLFYQIDDRDGMEYSASGNGLRPTINSYMYGDMVALQKIAKRLGKAEDEAMWAEKANKLRSLINTVMWDEKAEFYKNIAEVTDKLHSPDRYDHSNPNIPDTTGMEFKMADVREEVGYIPWYFNIPDSDEKSVAWKFLNDENHFYAPYGPTTAERCFPDFMELFDHECLWNGPSWPFATTQTLVAMANLLNNYNQDVVSKTDYFNLLKMYASEHYLEENGKKVPFIDEEIDPFTGEWATKKILEQMENPPGGAERGKNYNHSGFCDLVLSGLAGVRPRDDGALEINPMFDGENLDYMCADGIMYHGHSITVLWDKDGSRYGKGAGLHIYVDGKEAASQNTTDKVIIEEKF